MLLRCRSWVQKRGVKLELRHFPPSRDERSRKGRPGRGGREPRKEPIPPSKEDNLVPACRRFSNPEGDAAPALWVMESQPGSASSGDFIFPRIDCGRFSASGRCLATAKRVGLFRSER
jgi:hypothetical protein